MPTIKIIDLANNEEIEREMTAEEAEQFSKDQAAGQAEIEEKLAKRAAKQLLLDKLGISEEEARLLLA